MRSTPPRVGYGYDRVSNRTRVEDHLAEAASVNLDEQYVYAGHVVGHPECICREQANHNAQHRNAQ